MTRRECLGRLGRLGLVWLGLAALALLLAGVGYRCPILAVTGIPCPSCGITRGALALLRLDFAAAWRYNPLIFLLVGEGVWLSLCWLRGKLSPRHWQGALALYLFAGVVCWGLRIW